MVFLCWWHDAKQPAINHTYKGNVTNEEVYAKIQPSIGQHKDRLTIVRRAKLQWYGHISHSSGLAKKHLAKHSERGTKTWRPKETVRNQHPGMDRPGVWQVPEDSGEHGRMQKTGRKASVTNPMTLTVKGLMMMMMMMMTMIMNQSLNEQLPINCLVRQTVQLKPCIRRVIFKVWSSNGEIN